MIDVLSVEGLTTVQDLGRHHWAHLGVSPSGAADQGSHRLANRLVGNDERAASLEVTFGGLRLRFRRASVVGVTGAPCAVRVRGGPALAVGARAVLPAGAEVSLDRPSRGVRTYLAVRGGVGVELVLGSRSTDTLGGLGPRPLAAGHVLPVGPEPPTALGADFSPRGLPERGTLVLWPGPRSTDDLLHEVVARCWRVGSESDRVGIRLTPDTPVAPPTPIGCSDPLIAGAVQMTPAGHLVLMLADHPTTGGYPVVAVVGRSDLDLAAQTRPGEDISFCTPTVGPR